MNEGSTQERQL